MPRFAPDNFAANRRLFDAYAGLAAEAGCTPAQLALAWLLARDARIVPIPGTTCATHLLENLGAARVPLGSALIDRLDELLRPGSVRGARYNEQTLREVDSEAFEQ